MNTDIRWTWTPSCSDSCPRTLQSANFWHPLWHIVSQFFNIVCWGLTFSLTIFLVSSDIFSKNIFSAPYKVALQQRECTSCEPWGTSSNFTVNVHVSVNAKKNPSNVRLHHLFWMFANLYLHLLRSRTSFAAVFASFTVISSFAHCFTLLSWSSIQEQLYSNFSVVCQYTFSSLLHHYAAQVKNNIFCGILKPHLTLVRFQVELQVRIQVF